MPFMNLAMTRRFPAAPSGGGPSGDGDGVMPIIGIADWDSPRTAATILSLRDVQRGNYAGVANPPRDASGNFHIPPFSVDAGSGNDGAWIAFPKVYGEIRFKELTRSGNPGNYTFTDTWDLTMDGAHGDPISGPYGPKEIIVPIDGIEIPFYVYVSDWPGTGLLHYRAYQ